MILRTVARDCLYLNWAFPRAALPPLPKPLRYQVHAAGGEEQVFGSALLFRQAGLQLANVPLLRLSYPQFNLRLNILDGDGVPSVFFCCMMVPRWVLPGARLLARQPACGGRLSFPRPSEEIDAPSWSWEVRREGRLRVSARQSAPQVGHGPSLGSWERTTAYFRQRTRGYLIGGGRLRRVETTQPPAAIWPLEVEVEEAGLLERCLPLGGAGWPGLHSAWLCPEIPFVFELGVAELRAPLARPATPVAADPAMFAAAPSASRRAAA